MSVQKIHEYRTVIQYDGANSAAVLAAVGGDITIVTETGGVLTVDTCGNTWAINTGDWVRFGQGCVHAVYTPAQLAEAWLIDTPPPAQWAGTVTTGSDGRATASFPTGRFTAAPVVAATAVGTTDNQVRIVEIESVSATAVTVRAFTTQQLILPGLLAPVAPVATDVHLSARAAG